MTCLYYYYLMHYLRSFCAAGLWNLLRHWSLSGAKESPEEMARMYRKWLSAA